jgi:hypothetical protein
MKRLIKFKTASGRVPDFVVDYEGMPSVNGEHVGLSVNTATDYMPSTVRIINADQFRAHCLEATKDYGEPSDGQHLLDKWEAQGGVKVDTDDIVTYIPAKLVFDRLKAKGKFMAAWNLLTEEQRIEVTLLQQGFDQADPQVRGLITIVGEDPDKILAEEGS